MARAVVGDVGVRSASKVGHYLRPVHSQDRLSMELSGRCHSNHRLERKGLSSVGDESLDAT